MGGGSRGLVDGTVSPRSWAGTDAATLEDHIEALCTPAPTPVEEALGSGKPVFTTVDLGTEQGDTDTRTVVVPLSYRGAEYGVLVIETTDNDAVDLLEVEVFSELGRTVADAISAVESKQTLARQPDGTRIPTDRDRRAAGRPRGAVGLYR